MNVLVQEALWNGNKNNTVKIQGWWQSTVIAVLTKLDVIPQDGAWVFYQNIHQVALGLQNFLICIEMFLCAVGLAYSFSHHPFIDNGALHEDCFRSFLSMWDVRDMGKDVVDHARYLGRGAKKKASQALLRRRNDSTEQTPLLAAADSSISKDSSDLSSVNRRPPTPPVVVEAQGNEPGVYDSHSISEAEWERSGESFLVQSATSSMNNYLEFSNSVEEVQQNSAESLLKDSERRDKPTEELV
ncbi:hypothetical protein C0Q70_06556 [Pomacea canaliculata]|uniref:Uncharacterized protein n=1 Tax=Pomacea canaliculata TaxID=400727 RepID=A0A2T7PPB8_POMCA|nr:hypothetical protein C0Q70_06556 [Pomacea canaliculata]